MCNFNFIHYGICNNLTIAEQTQALAILTHLGPQGRCSARWTCSSAQCSQTNALQGGWGMGNFSLKISVLPQPTLGLMTLYMVSSNTKWYNLVYPFVLFAKTFFLDSLSCLVIVLFTLSTSLWSFHRIPGGIIQIFQERIGPLQIFQARYSVTTYWHNIF